MIKIEFLKKTSPLIEKPFFLRNHIKETSIKKKNSFFFEIIVHSLHATPKKDLKGGASPKEDLGGGHTGQNLSVDREARGEADANVGGPGQNAEQVESNPNNGQGNVPSQNQRNQSQVDREKHDGAELEQHVSHGVWVKGQPLPRGQILNLELGSDVRHADVEALRD